MGIKKTSVNKYCIAFYMFSLFAGIVGVAISGRFFSEVIDGYVHVRWFKYILIFTMLLCMVLQIKNNKEKSFAIVASVLMQVLLGTVLFLTWINDFYIKLAFAYIIILIVTTPFQFTRRMMIATPLVWITLAAIAAFNVEAPGIDLRFFLFFLIFPPLLILAVSLERLDNSIKLEKLALYDPLTDIPNREYAKYLIESKIKAGKQFGFLFIDLDNFKEINDTYGHHEGDRILKSVAESFKRGIREKDMVGRMCGDEFLIMLMDCEFRRDLENVFERIDAKFDVKIRGRDVTYSVGAVMYPGDASSYDEILKKADIAMYKSKGKGKNQISFYDDEFDLFKYAKNYDA